MPNNSAETSWFCAWLINNSWGEIWECRSTDQNFKKVLLWGTGIGKVLPRIGGEWEEGNKYWKLKGL